MARRAVRISITGDSREFAAALQKGEQDFSKFSNNVKKSAREVDAALNFKPTVAGGTGAGGSGGKDSGGGILGGIFAGGGVAKLATAIAGVNAISLGIREVAIAIPQANAELDNFNLRLQALTDGQASFADSTGFVSAEAARTNRDLSVLRTGYAKLLPLIQSSVLTTDQARKTFQGYQDVVATTGATNVQLAQSLFGATQGLTTGILRAEELNQVVEPLPGLLQALDAAAGLPAGGFRKLVNEGKITSSFFRDTLIKAFEEYEGAAERAAGATGQILQAFSNELRIARENNELVTSAVELIAETGTGALKIINLIAGAQENAQISAVDLKNAIRGYSDDINSLDISGLPQDLQLQVRATGIEDTRADFIALIDQVDRLEESGGLDQETASNILATARAVEEAATQRIQALKNSATEEAAIVASSERDKRRIAEKEQQSATREVINQVKARIREAETAERQGVRTIQGLQVARIQTIQDAENRVRDLRRASSSPGAAEAGDQLETFTLEQKLRAELIKVIEAEESARAKLASVESADPEDRLKIIEGLANEQELIFERAKGFQDRIKDLGKGLEGEDGVSAVRKSAAGDVALIDAQIKAETDRSALRQETLQTLSEELALQEQILESAKAATAEFTDSKQTKLELDAETFRGQIADELKALEDLTKPRSIDISLPEALSQQVNGITQELTDAQRLLTGFSLAAASGRDLGPEYQNEGLQERLALTKEFNGLLSSGLKSAGDLEANLQSLSAINVDIEITPKSSPNEIKAAAQELSKVFEREFEGPTVDGSALLTGFGTLPLDLVNTEQLGEAEKLVERFTARLAAIDSDPSTSLLSSRAELVGLFNEAKSAVEGLRSNSINLLNVDAESILRKLKPIQEEVDNLSGSVLDISAESVAKVRLEADTVDAERDLLRVSVQARELVSLVRSLPIAAGTNELLTSTRDFLAKINDTLSDVNIVDSATLDPLKAELDALRGSFAEVKLQTDLEVDLSKAQADIGSFRDLMADVLSEVIPVDVDPQVDRDGLLGPLGSAVEAAQDEADRTPIEIEGNVSIKRDGDVPDVGGDLDEGTEVRVSPVVETGASRELGAKVARDVNAAIASDPIIIDADLRSEALQQKSLLAKVTIDNLATAAANLRSKLADAGDGEEILALFSGVASLEQQLNDLSSRPYLFAVEPDIEKAQARLAFLFDLFEAEAGINVDAGVTVSEEDLARARDALEAGLPPVVVTGNTSPLDSDIAASREKIEALRRAAANIAIGSGGASRTGFWTGGVVTGPGGFDNVPADLTAGEFVVTKSGQNIGSAVRHALAKNPALANQVKLALDAPTKGVPFLTPVAAGVRQQFATGGVVRPQAGAETMNVNLFAGSKGPYTVQAPVNVARELRRALKSEARGQ